MRNVLRYIGSKHSLKDFIFDNIKNVVGNNGNIIADLFAGAGSIGKIFRENGYKVIANDLFYHSFIINSHNLINDINNVNVDRLDMWKKIFNNEIFSNNFIKGFIYNNYCLESGCQRGFLTEYNAMKCDSIRKNLNFSKEIDRYCVDYISSQEYITLLAGLILSVDEVMNGAGTQSAFLKHFKGSSSKNMVYNYPELMKGNLLRGKVYNESADELINKISGDILYLDPPYNTRQYIDYYHLSETIAKYDNPDIKGVGGIRMDRKQYKSKWCSKSMVYQVFENIIKNADFKYIFLSYNNEGLMKFDDIKEIMKKYGKYELFQTDYKRFKQDSEENRNIKTKSTIEYLHCLIK